MKTILFQEKLVDMRVSELFKQNDTEKLVNSCIKNNKKLTKLIDNTENKHILMLIKKKLKNEKNDYTAEEAENLLIIINRKLKN